MYNEGAPDQRGEELTPKKGVDRRGKESDEKRQEAIETLRYLQVEWAPYKYGGAEIPYKVLKERTVKKNKLSDADMHERIMDIYKKFNKYNYQDLLPKQLDTPEARKTVASLVAFGKGGLNVFASSDGGVGTHAKYQKAAKMVALAFENLCGILEQRTHPGFEIFDTGNDVIRRDIGA